MKKSNWKPPLRTSSIVQDVRLYLSSTILSITPTRRTIFRAWFCLFTFLVLLHFTVISRRYEDGRVGDGTYREDVLIALLLKKSSRPALLRQKLIEYIRSMNLNLSWTQKF